MDSEVEALEEKLKSLVGQLQAECAIFERLVYKNKNQHRRSSYFQFLLKVRRDLRLLQSVKLEELLGSCFLVMTGKRPKQKVHLLESLKRRKCDGGKYNFLERLLGAARLLSQMVEPMLRAATEVSTLLARSFFMSFSLSILALLARLRVLVQQILLDVVSVFNMVSSLSQKHQSIRINQEGIEVYREFYPTNEKYITLECVWNTDKFVLLERSHKSETESQERDGENNFPIGDSAVRYLSIESFLGDDEPDSDKAEAENTTAENPVQVYEETNLIVDDEPDSDKAEAENTTTENPVQVNGETNLFASPSVKNDEEPVQVNEVTNLLASPSVKNDEEKQADGIGKAGNPNLTSSSPSSNPLKVMLASRKVAFVSVKRPVPTTSNSLDVNDQETEKKNDDKEDKFYDLLTGGNLKDSLF